MPFLVLLILTLAYLQNAWPAPPEWLTPLGSVLVTWLGVVALVAFAGWLVHCLRWRLHRHPDCSSRWLRRFFRWRKLHLTALVLGYFLTSYAAGWGWTVKTCLTYGQWSIPGTELLILMPFLVGLFLSWGRFYDAEVAVQRFHSEFEDDAFLSRWTYVGLQARQSLILAAPPFLMLLIQQSLLGLFPQLEQRAVMPVVSAILLLVMFMGQPWLLRLLLNLQPIPDGRLRRQLQQTADRCSFNCNDILVWNTHDSLASAMLAGPVRWLRYVVFTDRLLARMEDDEIAAVFAHEVGHVKHRHLSLYFVFLLASLLVLSAVWNTALTAVGLQNISTFLVSYTPWPEFCRANLQLLLALPLFLFMLVYFLLVFGLLSRRCERQADIYACRQVSFEAFISALEKVAWLNGMSRKRPGWLSSWRHGTIAQRVACLRLIQAEPRIEVSVQQNINIIKWGLLAALAGVLLLIGPERVWEMFRQW